MALFQFFGDVEHGFAGGDDVVGDENVLALDRIAEIFVRDDGVAAVDDHGIVTALVEHTEIDTQRRRRSTCSGPIAPSSGEMIIKLSRVGLEVRDVVEQRLEHLIRRHHVVEAHQRHGVLHARIVSVKGHKVFDTPMLCSSCSMNAQSSDSR